MKRLAALAGFGLLLIPALPLQAETYAERLAAAQQKGDPAGTEQLLAEWAAKEPENPEALVAAANYWWSRSTSIEINRGKAAKGEFAMTDKDGKEVGRIGPGGHDEKCAAKAIATLEKAVATFPNRLDIWCGLSYLQQETVQTEAQIRTLQAMVAHAKKATADNLRWKDEPLGEVPGKFVAEKVHGYATDHYKKETPESDIALGKIATLLTTEYPENPIGWNDLALHRHFVGKDTKAAIGSLEKAQELDPRDFLVAINLGKFAVMAGDRDKARKAFQRVVDGSSDARLVAEAKKQLAGLKSKGK